MANCNHLLTCLCYMYFISKTLAFGPYNDPELLQIYANGEQLADRILSLAPGGTEVKLDCLYNNTFRGSWFAERIPADATPGSNKGYHVTQYGHPISTKLIESNPEDDFSCHYWGHERNLTVDILYPPENATISGPDVIHDGDHIEYTCSANANPAPAFTWTEDDRKGSTVSVSRKGNTVSFTCNVQNKMVPTFGDAVISPVISVRKSVRFEVSGNGGLIAAMVIGWIIAMVALAFALYVYMRDRGYKKTEMSKPLIRNTESLKQSSDEYRTNDQSTKNTSHVVQLSKILESDAADNLPAPDRPKQPLPTDGKTQQPAGNLPASERPKQPPPTDGKTQPPYLNLEQEEPVKEEEECKDTSADDTYEDVGDRSSGLRYDDLDESTMDKGSQLTDDYLTPISNGIP